MSTRPQVNDLQSSFGDILKKEFGTGVPQIATVVAVVLGSLGLKDYFDAGAWTVVAVLCFATIFLYRHQLPNRLSRATWLVLAFLVTSGVIGFCVLKASIHQDQLFLDWEKANKSLATAYFSFLTTMSVACLITSYRKQEKMLGLTYPRPIEDAVAEQLFSLEFYKEKVQFVVHIQAVENEWIDVVTEMSYDVVNRTDSQKRWELKYSFDRATGKLLSAQWDKEPLDVEDPHYLSALGFEVQRTMRPGQKSSAYVRVQERFRLREPGIYTSYHPATDLKVLVDNSVDKLKFYFDVLHFSDPPVVTAGKERSIHLKSGLLPFQGVIVKWGAN